MSFDARQLAQSAQVLEASLPLYRTLACDGVITAAYGDPGLQALRSGLPCPVVGIGASSMLEASKRGAFAVVTTTPDLAAPIEALATGLGLSQLFAGLWLTQCDPHVLLADPAHMEAELEAASPVPQGEG
jgi:Asp/Glu/hydantoin racemase